MANKWNKPPNAARNIYVTLVMSFFTIPGLEWGWLGWHSGGTGGVFGVMTVTSASRDMSGRDAGDGWGFLSVLEGR